MPTILKKRSHQWIDARSLAMCQLIAEKIRRQPELFQIAKQNLERWKKVQQPWPRALREWEEILQNNSLPQVLEILTTATEEGNRLRQSNPFPGVLTEDERASLLKEYESIGA